jgi:mitochondrial cardiolipin hydrolase
MAASQEVLFFPDPKLPCRSTRAGKTCKRGASCDFAHEPTNLSRFLDHLASARTSIDICIFSLTCDEIANEIIALHQRGVAIRVITDDDQAHSTGSDIARLRQEGIVCKVDHSPFHMHHKFAVIDGSLLLNGSFNWTRQAVLSNRENVMVIPRPALAQAFAAEFQRMWNAYTE